MGLGNRAVVSYSSIADGQRLTSVMVIGLPAAYVEFRVATGFTSYVLYGVFLSSLLKKVYSYNTSQLLKINTLCGNDGNVCSWNHGLELLH